MSTNNLKITSDLKRCILKSLPLYGFIFCILMAIALQPKIPISDLTRDVFSVANVPPYTGIISNLGALIWCYSFAISFFTYQVLKNNELTPKIVVNFFLFSSGISLMLLLDDFFMLHDSFFPYHLNIPEKVVYLFYISAIIYYLVRFRNIFFSIKNLFFLGAFFVFFGLSVGVDLLPNEIDYQAGHVNNIYFLFEDGSKLIAIASWCTYLNFICLEKMIFCFKKIGIKSEMD